MKGKPVITESGSVWQGEQCTKRVQAISVKDW